MEDRYIEEGVRSRLIQSGLKELLEHGSNDFSLRRVALSAQVSCAAPYRHFKDKDQLIRAVIAYIREDWNLLAGEISRIYEVGTAAHLTELLVAGVRFWIAGGNFASFLLVGEISSFDRPILDATIEYAKKLGLTDAQLEDLRYSVISLLYGTVTLVASGSMDIDAAMRIMREKLTRELK